MAYLGCCGLGANPISGAIQGGAVGSTAGPIGTAIGAVAGVIGSIIGGGPPVPEPGVQAQVDLWKYAALGGDPYAEAMLRGMSKMCRPEDDALLRAHPPQPPASGNLPWVPADCSSHGWARPASQAVGKAAIAEIEARRVAGQVGTTLIGQSNIPYQAQALFQNPLVLGGLAVGLYLLLRRR